MSDANGGEVDVYDLPNDQPNDRQNCRVGGGDDVPREHRGVSGKDSHDHGASCHGSHEDGESGDDDLLRKHRGVNDEETHDRGASGYENHENGGSDDGAHQSLRTRKDERTCCCLRLCLCIFVG